MAWRSLLTAIILASASTTLAGEWISIGVTPTTPGPYPPGEVVAVDLSWHQDGAFGEGPGGAINIRLMKFDFRNSSDELELTNFQWSWDGQGICGIVPALCGHNHTTDSSLPFVSATFLGLTLSNLDQVVIPPQGEVRVGTVNVVLPQTPGDYVVNANSPPLGIPPGTGAGLYWRFYGSECGIVGCPPFEGGVATLSVIPEPGTLVLVLLGIATLMRRGRGGEPPLTQQWHETKAPLPHGRGSVPSHSSGFRLSPE